MSDNVLKLVLENVGEGFRFDPDQILEAAKGKGFDRLIIVGEYADENEDDGDLYIAGTANAGESLFMLEWAKLQLLRR